MVRCIFHIDIYLSYRLLGLSSVECIFSLLSIIGPVTGKDVFIPMKSIIGGQSRCGFGWNMLMDCLAEGRSVSLPASAVGGAKMAVNGVGAYGKSMMHTLSMYN